MISKDQHIEFWTTNSNEDWETMLELLKSEKWFYALFYQLSHRKITLGLPD